MKSEVKMTKSWLIIMGNVLGELEFYFYHPVAFSRALQK